MNKQIEYFANLIFYHMFRFEKWTQSFFAAPFVWFIRLPAVNRYYKRRGTENKEAAYNRALYDKKVGASYYFASLNLTFLFCLITSGTANFLIGFLRIDVDPFKAVDLHFLIYVLVTFIPALAASEMLVDHKKKYLKYFNKFEHKSDQWHFRTATLSFFTVVGIWVYGCVGFFFYLSRL